LKPKTIHLMLMLIFIRRPRITIRNSRLLW